MSPGPQISSGATKSVTNLSETLRGVLKTQMYTLCVSKRKSANRQDPESQHVVGPTSPPCQTWYPFPPVEYLGRPHADLVQLV